MENQKVAIFTESLNFKVMGSCLLRKLRKSAIFDSKYLKVLL